MPLARLAGPPPPAAAGIVQVPMDGWNDAAGAVMLQTQGVADCLVMIMHCPNLQQGALAHLSWPAQAQGHGNNRELAIARNTVRVRDAMVNRLACAPNEIEVYLWRGFGFGEAVALIGDAGDILQNLPWGHFRLVIDMMAHGDYLGPNDSTPFPGCGTASYVPNANQAWFN